MSRWLVLLSLCVVSCDQSPPTTGLPSPEDLAGHNAAVAAMGAYDYAQAMSILEPLWRTYPGNDAIAIDLSIAQLNRQMEGDEAAALERLDEVILRAPGNLRAQYTAGILRFNAGDLEEARRHFQYVHDADPQDAFAAYYLGQSMAQLDDLPGALSHFDRAMEADPYLRSAYYAAAQAARRTGDGARAQSLLEAFTRLEHNPRAQLAEIKYTRMGPKAEIGVLDGQVSPGAHRPDGPVFAVDEAQHTSCDECPAWTSVSVSALGEDGWIVATSSAGSLELHAFDDSRWFEPIAGAFTSTSSVRASMWGDVDADGHVDLVLCRTGDNQLWRGQGGDAFIKDDRFDGGGEVDSVDGALFDADHDGDLDVFFVNQGGASVLVNNNGDGTWQRVADDVSGFPDAGGDGREIIVADLDGDLDTDIIQINEQPPHAVWINDRLWNWVRGDESWADLVSADVPAAAAGDLDADGEVELVALDEDWSVHVWDRRDGRWGSSKIADALSAEQVDAEAVLVSTPSRPRRLALADITGDGRLDVLAPTGWQRRWQGRQPPVMRLLDAHGSPLQRFDGHGAWTLWNRQPGSGPGYLGVGDQSVVTYLPPGPGRFPFVDLEFAGRHDTGQSMRSNASGIGTRIGVRVGSRWTVLGALRDTAGPGQDFQPMAVGLGGASQVDFIAIDWTDGVYQTEAGLTPGRVHRIVETQRQLSSCPLIFARTEDGMTFLTDCLGVGGMGFLLEPGVYATPRPRERVLLDRSFAPPNDGTLEFVLAEPMQETCYLDAVALEVIDLPEPWEVLPDERMGTGVPEPTSALLYARRFEMPSSARDARGRDVLDALARQDGWAVDPGEVDGRFMGRVIRPHVLELEFTSELDAIDQPVLVLEAWVEYPYSQTMFAAWQAGLGYHPLTIEARDDTGRWHLVHEHVGYPAGMPRTAVLPLADLPQRTNALRLTTTLEVYVDRVRVAALESPEDALVQRLDPHKATLEHPGYPRRLTGAQKRPDYDWADRATFWDVRVQSGRYTRLGDVSMLLGDRDGALAVFGAGDAVRVVFPQPRPCPDGYRRHVVLDVAGWCKDRDLFTWQGGTVGPIPGQGGSGLTEAMRTRHRSGR